MAYINKACLVKSTSMIKLIKWFIAALILTAIGEPAFAFHPDIYSPRVPKEQLEMIQEIEDPYPPSLKRTQKGREIYFGKGLCATCHSKDGKGVKASGHVPRDFTDIQWQDIRSDGELMWILKNGSPGTGMPVRVGNVITEEEGWDVIHFIRSFSRK